MRILITGAKGQLGQTLSAMLALGQSAIGPIPQAFAGADVRGIDLPELDLSRLEDTLAYVKELQPEVIFHCAAFTQVDRCEEDADAAFRGNALASRNIATAAAAVGAKVLCLSTDYVFDGAATAPIPEWTLPNPQSVYGHSKLLGEQYVREFSGGRYFVVRTAWLYGKTGGNFVKTMLRLAREKGRVTVVQDQLGSPTYAEDLAHHLLKVAVTEEYGVYHIGGQGVCSWYEFAREIIRLSGQPCEVIPCTTAEYAVGKKNMAHRPAYSGLARMMLTHTVGDEMRPWQEALADYMRSYDKESGEIRA